MRFLRGFFALLLLAIATPASAHTVIVSFSPEKSATLSASPTQVVITTDDQVQDMGTAITVVSPSGQRVDDGSTEVDGKLALIGLTQLTEVGTYTVNYRLLAQDGHALEGSYTFTLTNGSSPSPSPSPQPTNEPTPASNNNYLLYAALAVVALTSLVLLIRRSRDK